MARPASKYPTQLELEILKILWKGEPLSGRRIRDQLEPVRDLTYTSVMTMLGIMEEKQYVRRRKVGGNYLYFARLEQQAASQGMLRDLVERVFDGSVLAAMINLLDVSEVDPDELRRLRKLIQDKAKEQP